MRMMGGFEDLTPGRASDGIAAIQMRAWHCLETPIGGLPQDPTWGWGLPDKIGVGLAPGDLKLEEQIGRAALKKDPEIRNATVAITMLDSTRMRVSIHLETTRGPIDIERDLA